MTYDALAWWQFALRLVFTLIVVVGIVRLFRRKGGANSARRRRAAPIAIGLGIVGLLATKRLTQPPSHPGSGSRPKGSALAKTTVSDRSFDSNDEPAVAIEAPQGWRVEFDSSQRLLMVINGREPINDAPAVFQVKSATVSDEVHLDEMQRVTSNELRKQGLTVGDSFSETIDGMPAVGVTASNDEEEKCAWFVKRAAKHVSVLMCASRDVADAREACRPVLERLKWRAPVVD